MSIVNFFKTVLDKGFIRVVDAMGDDGAVVQAARVSYGKGTKTVNEDAGLINYLMKYQHTSPFEMNEIKLHVKMPIFVARQWIRHRTANVNEYSARYSEIKDEFYIPTQDRITRQDKDKKQCSSEEILDCAEDFVNYTEEVANNSLAKYTYFNNLGLAREVNRINIPLSNYTEFYWKIDLHNLLHFIKLRIHPHAQYEIRVYAEVLLEIVKIWCPLVYEAFVEHRLEAQTFSKSQLEAIKKLIHGASFEEATKGLKKRENEEVKDNFFNSI